MSKDERREMKERLEAIRTYIMLEEEAKAYCNDNPQISSKRWFRYYGLYCSGKDIQADVRALGEILLNKEVKLSLGYGQSIISMSRQAITQDLTQNLVEEETPTKSR